MLQPEIVTNPRMWFFLIEQVHTVRVHLYSAPYLKAHGVVTEEALVFQGHVEALFGPEVNPRTWSTLLRVEHVLLQRSRSSG